MGSATQIQFGRFVLNLERGCLQTRTGAELFLRPKSFRLLEVLVARAGALVSKDDLASAVWPNVIVSDDSVAHCVSDIRKALGPDGAHHIRTVPRRGYMFLPEAHLPVRASGNTRRSPSPRSPSRRSVRPVAALAGALACLAVVWVLVDAGPGWRPAALVAADAPDRAQPPARPRPPDDAAAAAFRRADDLLKEGDWTRRGDNETARDLLEELVAEDPGRAEAWASLGLTYWREVQHLSWAGGRREMRRALEMVEKSIALGASPRAHRLLAEMRLLAPFDEMRSPLDALAAAQAAVEMDPDDPDSLAVLAEVLALTGRTEDAIAAIERARRINPDHPAWYDRVAGISYFGAGMPARAAEAFGPLYEAGQLTHARAWSGWLLAASLAQSGRQVEAKRVVGDALRRSPGTTLDMVAVSLDGFDRPETLQPILEGLRRAGLPG